MVASQKLTYDGRKLSPGDPFCAVSDRDAKTLEALGKARRAKGQTVEAKKPKKGYNTRNMKARD